MGCGVAMSYPSISVGGLLENPVTLYCLEMVAWEGADVQTKGKKVMGETSTDVDAVYGCGIPEEGRAVSWTLRRRSKRGRGGSPGEGWGQ